MKPLNVKERTKAIYKVVGLFAVSLIIAVLLAFTTMKSPQVSNSMSTRKLQKLEKSLQFQREVFTPDVAQASNKLAKIPTHKQDDENIEVLNSDIGAILSNSKSQIREIESPDTILYKNIIQSLSDLQIAYNKQVELSEGTSDNEEMEVELRQLEQENRALKNEVRALGGASGKDCEKYKKLVKKAEERLAISDMENRALKKEIERLRNQ
ncbi:MULTISPECIES: type VI secretion system TssO [unclassified Saccharicrinis]|uniref:type VI secretion system TssO n=1 Tax=unclassified Saccharicrinis TaxID=2646859 RepID=UPI003D353C14